VHQRRLARGVIGGIEHRSKLHEFRGLQVGYAEEEPALRAVHLAAHARDQHQHQQDDAEQEQPWREALPDAHRHLEGGQRGDEAQREKDRVPHQKIGG